ncbi:MAG: SH3 domain-containing protein [Devosia sp.]
MSFKHALALGGFAAAMLGTTVASLAAPAIATSTVNVRSGPGTQFSVVDSLRSGQRVDVEGCRAGWCYVNKPGPDGWVSGRYLTEPAGRGRPRVYFDFNFGRPPMPPPPRPGRPGWDGPDRPGPGWGGPGRPGGPGWDGPGRPGGPGWDGPGRPGRPGDGPGRPGDGPDRPGDGPGRPGDGPGRPGDGPGRPGDGPGRPGDGPGRPGDGPGRPDLPCRPGSPIFPACVN